MQVAAAAAAAAKKKKKVHDEFSDTESEEEEEDLENEEKGSEDEDDSDFEDPDLMEVPGGGRDLTTLQKVKGGPGKHANGKNSKSKLERSYLRCGVPFLCLPIVHSLFSLRHLYRVSHLLVDSVRLTCVLCVTVCPILPWLMGIWQKRLETQMKVNPTQAHEQMGHPV